MIGRVFRDWVSRVAVGQGRWMGEVVAPVAWQELQPPLAAVREVTMRAFDAALRAPTWAGAANEVELWKFPFELVWTLMAFPLASTRRTSAPAIPFPFPSVSVPAKVKPWLWQPFMQSCPALCELALTVLT